VAEIGFLLATFCIQRIAATALVRFSKRGCCPIGFKQGGRTDEAFEMEQTEETEKSLTRCPASRCKSFTSVASLSSCSTRLS
jgi:hypothetical protein